MVVPSDWTSPLRDRTTAIPNVVIDLNVVAEAVSVIVEAAVECEVVVEVLVIEVVAVPVVVVEVPVPTAVGSGISEDKRRPSSRHLDHVPAIGTAPPTTYSNK